MDFYVITACAVMAISAVAAVVWGVQTKTSKRGGLCIIAAATCLAVAVLSLCLGFQHVICPHPRAIPRAAQAAYPPTVPEDEGAGDQASRPDALPAPLWR